MPKKKRQVAEPGICQELLEELFGLVPQLDGKAANGYFSMKWFMLGRASKENQWKMPSCFPKNMWFDWLWCTVAGRVLYAMVLGSFPNPGLHTVLLYSCACAGSLVVWDRASVTHAFHIIEESFASRFPTKLISMEVKSPERRGRMGEVQQIGCPLFMLWTESLGRGKEVKEVKAVNPRWFLSLSSQDTLGLRLKLQILWGV